MVLIDSWFRNGCQQYWELGFWPEKEANDILMAPKSVTQFGSTLEKKPMFIKALPTHPICSTIWYFIRPKNGSSIVALRIKIFETNFDPNFLLHSRGTIFGPNIIPNRKWNWMCGSLIKLQKRFNNSETTSMPLNLQQPWLNWSNFYGCTFFYLRQYDERSKHTQPVLLLFLSL